MTISLSELTVPSGLNGNQFFGVAVSPDEAWIFLGASSGTSYMMKRAVSGNFETFQTISGLPTGQSLDAVFTANSSSIYMCIGSTVYKADLTSPGGVDTWTVTSNFSTVFTSAGRGIDLSPNGAHLAVGMVSGALKIIDLTNSNAVLLNTTLGDFCEDVKYSRDGNFVAAVWRNSGLKLWSISGTTYTAGTVVNGEQAKACWSLAWKDTSDAIIAGSYISGNQTWGYLKTGTTTFTGSALQTTFNGAHNFWLDKKYAVSSTFDSAGQAPKSWSEVSAAWTAETNNLPVMLSNAARSAVTGTGKIAAWVLTVTSGQPVRVWTMPPNDYIDANFVMPLVTMDASLRKQSDLDADFIMPLVQMDATAASIAQEYPPYLPFQFRQPYIQLVPTGIETTTELLPLAVIEFSYAAYGLELEAQLVMDAEVVFTYGAYDLAILSGIKAEIEFSYGAYAMASVIDDKIETDIVFTYGAYAMAAEIQPSIGVYVNFTYGSYAMVAELDAEFGSRVEFSYGAYDMAAELEVSLPIDATFTYGAYEIEAILDAPVAAAITFSYGSYAMAGEAAIQNSAIFTYGAYDMAMVASAPVVVDIKFSYGAYDMAALGSMVANPEIVFSYNAYGIDIAADAISNNALTFILF